MRGRTGAASGGEAVSLSRLLLIRLDAAKRRLQAQYLYSKGRDESIRNYARADRAAEARALLPQPAEEAIDDGLAVLLVDCFGERLDARTPFVERFTDAPPDAGGWGATIAYLLTDEGAAQ